MALTKEERSALAKRQSAERKERERERERRYPTAVISSYKEQDSCDFIQVRLDPELPNHLIIRYKGDGWFHPDPEHPDVQVAEIRLKSILTLAELIRGLVARYNDRIEELNREVEGTPLMEVAKTFAPNGADPDELPHATL